MWRNVTSHNEDSPVSGRESGPRNVFFSTNTALQELPSGKANFMQNSIVRLKTPSSTEVLP
jgi:hypothetical protein